MAVFVSSHMRKTGETKSPRSKLHKSEPEAQSGSKKTRLTSHYQKQKAATTLTWLVLGTRVAIVCK